MLVKELRQGLRTNLFVVAFILLQTFMVLCLMAGLADPNSNDADGFFWFFIIVTLLLVQPLRGFSALSSEYTLNTMVSGKDFCPILIPGSHAAQGHAANL